MFGDDRGPPAALRQAVQPGKSGIDIGIPVHIGEHHAAHFQELDIRFLKGSIRERRAQQLLRALRIGPVEHLDAIERRPGNGAADHAADRGGAKSRQQSHHHERCAIYC